MIKASICKVGDISLSSRKDIGALFQLVFSCFESEGERKKERHILAE